MKHRYEYWSMNGVPNSVICIEEEGEERRVQILVPCEPPDCWKEEFVHTPLMAEWEWFLDFAGIGECSSKYQQHIISQVLKQNPVECIVELGTFKGAGALYLGVCGAVMGLPVYTFDRDLSLSDEARPGLDRLGVFGIECDYLKPEGKAEVLSVIANRRAYLICDGDALNKATEFNEFVPLLKRGSVVSVHDWNAEVTRQDIEATVEKYRMRPFGRRDWSRHFVQFATFVKEAE